MPPASAFGRRRLLVMGATAALAAPIARPAARQHRRILRLGHVHGAEGAVARGVEHAAAILRDRSDGKLHIEQVPEARLGSERETLEQVRERTLDLCLAPPASLTIGCTRAMVLDSPFLARDFDHVLRTYGTAPYQAGLRSMEISDLAHLGVGLRAFAPWYLGTRHMTTHDRPIRGPEDMAGLRMRIGDGQTMPAMMRALGAVPVAMSEAEMRHALGAHAIDGQEGPLATVAGNRLLEVQRCLSLTGHVVMSLMPVANADAWRLLHDNERDALEAALRDGGAVCTRLAREQERLLLREFGQGDVRIVAGDHAAFRRALVPFYEQFRRWWGGMEDLMEAL